MAPFRISSISVTLNKKTELALWANTGQFWLYWKANGTDGSEVQDNDSGFISEDHMSASRPPTAFHLPALTKPVPPSLPELHISLGTAPGPSALGIGFSDIKRGRKKEALSSSLLLLRIPAHAVPEQKWLIYKKQTKQSLQNFLHFCSFGVYTRLCHDHCAT